MWNASSEQIRLSREKPAHHGQLQHNRPLDIHPITWNST
jgi:hypothetical protein